MVFCLPIKAAFLVLNRKQRNKPCFAAKAKVRGGSPDNSLWQGVSVRNYTHFTSNKQWVAMLGPLWKVGEQNHSHNVPLSKGRPKSLPCVANQTRAAKKCHPPWVLDCPNCLWWPPSQRADMHLGESHSVLALQLPGHTAASLKNNCKCVHDPWWHCCGWFCDLETDLSFCYLSFSEVESTRDPGICISNLVCPAIFIILALRSISPGCLDLIPDSRVVCFVGLWFCFCLGFFCFFFSNLFICFIGSSLCAGFL